jgi:cyclopropane fatty-acyl-phospholipid synthase-like methyltransferase
VYASHLFEHLAKHDAAVFLKEARRVLRPGGVIRLVVPDLRRLAEAYVEALAGGDDRASERFLYALNMHADQTYGPDRTVLVRLVNWLQGYPHQHKYMYDAATLGSVVSSHGFRAVRAATYGRSELIPEIADVEHTAEGIPSVYVEAVRA